MKPYDCLNTTAIFLGAALLLSACVKQDLQPEAPTAAGMPLEVNVALTPQTRSVVTGTEFSNGQRINIILQDAGATQKYQGVAMQYEYKKPVPNDPGIWAPTLTEGLLVSDPAKVYAHYPATLQSAYANLTSDQDSLNLSLPSNLDLGTIGISATYESFYMAVDKTKPDQKKEIFSSKEDIDYMTGRGNQVTSVPSTAKKTTITLKHALAMVIVYVYREPGMPDKPNVEEISITNLAGGTAPLKHGAVSLDDDTFIPDLRETSYTRTMSGFPVDNARYAMLVYPAAMVQGDVQMTLTADQFKYTMSMPAKTWKSGHVYLYNVKITPNTATIQDVQLLDWPAWTEKSLILD